MIEIYGNLFEPETYCTSDRSKLYIEPNAVCLTTNGFVKKNGECVMGKGCAAQAKRYWPDVAKHLGNLIKKNGNRVQVIHGPPHVGIYHVLSFPVKPVKAVCDQNKSNVVEHMQGKFNHGSSVPGWAAVADPKLIETSAYQLLELADENNWNHVILPRAGAGAGELDWYKDVKPILEEILDDRFFAITFPQR